MRPAARSGSGRVLSGLVDRTGDIDTPCLPVAGSAGRFLELHAALATLFTHGHDLRWEVLFEGRLVRPFVPPAELRFIVNPCERPMADAEGLRPDATDVAPANWEPLSRFGIDPATLEGYLTSRGRFLADVIRADLRSADVAIPTGSASDRGPAVEPPRAAPRAVTGHVAGGSTIDRLRQLVADRTGYPLDSIPPSARLLDDLNLDSIKAGELVAAAADVVGLSGQLDPSRFANATLADVAEALDALGPDASDEEDAVGEPPQDALSALVALVADVTGYPLDSIPPSARLLDDLNLDSIKAGELIARAATELGLSGTIEPGRYANARLDELAAVLLGDDASAPDTPMDQSVVLAALFEEVELLTGFPRGALTADAHLSRDLGLGVDRVGALLDACARSLGTSPIPASADLLNGTLAQLAERLASPNRRAAESAAPTDITTSDRGWVRELAVDVVEAPRAAEEPLPFEDLRDAQVRILVEATEGDVGEALARSLEARGAAAEVLSFERASAEPRSCTHLIGVLPRRAAATERSASRVAAAVNRLCVVATALSPAPPSGARSSGSIQFGGGRFGADASRAELDTSCATAFARSLHLERPELRVRLLDFAASSSAAQVAAESMLELGGPTGFAASGFDARGARFVQSARRLDPAEYAPRALDLSPEDVVLVTGGARGITAECALAVAERSGCRLALVGSTNLASADVRTRKEIAATLERARAAGVRASYFPCDITNGPEVSELVERVRAVMGDVTAVVHGAGRNVPRRTETVESAAALREIAPKLLGALNLCEALADAPPKLFVALTSIIGVTGMPGNAWYAFSNESLDLVMRRFGKAHPSTQVCSIAYSIWSQVGMGARLGSVEALAKRGIGAIPPDEGVSRFVRLFERAPGVEQVVVTAALAGLDTWPADRPVVNRALRFVDHVVSVFPEVELVTRTRLTLERDRYLRDHDFDGSYLFPTVFGLEAMFQAVATLTGCGADDLARIEDVRLERPIVVDPQAGTEIEICVEVLERVEQREPRRVRAAVRTSSTGFTRDHFAAVFVLGAAAEASEEPLPPPEDDADLSPRRDLYGGLLFQGELFQRMSRVTSLDSRHAVMEAAVSARSMHGRGRLRGRRRAGRCFSAIPTTVM